MSASSSLWTSGPIWGAAGVFITALFAWLTQRNRGQVDESVAVRQQWEKLTGGLQERLSAVEKEFADYRIEMARRIGEIEKAHAEQIAEMRRVYDARLKAQQDLNEGLQRQIIQNSQSSAHMLGQHKRTRPGGKRRPLGEEDE